MEPLLWGYAEGVLDLHQPFYKESVFKEMPEVLPEEVQLALKLKKVRQYREERDDIKTLEAVRKCLGVCAAMGDVIDVYARICRDEVQNRSKSQEADDSKAELRFLIAALKRKAKQQMEKEEYGTAREILLQIQQCAPEDEEVKELLERMP